MGIERKKLLKEFLKEKTKTGEFLVIKFKQWQNNGDSSIHYV